MLKTACEESARFHESLDPSAAAAFAVSWAGEAASLNWFDTARESPNAGITSSRSGSPTVRGSWHLNFIIRCWIASCVECLDYIRDAGAPAGTVVLVEISGDCGGQWFLSKGQAGWGFAARAGSNPLPPEHPQHLAWQLFTKGVDRNRLARRCASREIESLASHPAADRYSRIDSPLLWKVQLRLARHLG